MPHTPGPWSMRDETERVFAEDGWGLVADCGQSVRAGEIEANARLIAAAPELLAAAEYALARLTNPAPIRSDQIMERVATCDTLLAAIRRARGEE